MPDGVLDSSPPSREELVVLVDDDARPVGTLPKAAVHHRSTPLHLGFSCYLFDRRGRVLLTRRALTKPTWPGVWTNSCCGHPLPDEPLPEAVRRRARHELGLHIDHVQCVLPRFRYRAIATDGTVENELCPVFCARAHGAVQPAADEVMDWRWVLWSKLRAAAELSWPLSPWAAAQVPLLDDADIGRWGQGSG